MCLLSPIKIINPRDSCSSRVRFAPFNRNDLSRNKRRREKQKESRRRREQVSFSPGENFSGKIVEGDTYCMDKLVLFRNEVRSRPFSSNPCCVYMAETIPSTKGSSKTAASHLICKFNHPDRTRLDKVGLQRERPGTDLVSDLR